MESYNKKLLEQIGINFDFIQDNQSFSKQAGVLRGLHYQLIPMAQTKMVRVCSGAIFDVIVDIRDRGIAWNDPDIGIDWPISTPILSSKDSNHPLLKKCRSELFYEGVINK
jgi:dTDP-4-dehydrorhamnose 3,5-epimerase